MIKKLLFALVTLLFLGFGFVYVPIPALETPYADRARSMDEAALAFFESIEAGRNLDRPFPPMPIRADNPVTDEKVALGKLLYFDPILSGSNATSCAHCHHPDLGFADNRRLSMGVGGDGVGPDRTGGALLPRNTPTVWNAAYNHAQFWDGRSTDLEDQAANPIQAEDEMNQNAEELVEELKAVPEYVRLFDLAFEGENGSGVTFQNVTYAVGAFERTVLSRNSRFDQYAKGNHAALTARERHGLNLFRSLKTRCFECHNLPTFNNPDFKVVGVPALPDQEVDLGRGAIEGDGYNHAFKVPTLRNVALTAPYMHNGIFLTLEEVLDFYGQGGGLAHGFDAAVLDDKIRPFSLSEAEKAALIAFLHALTDESAKPSIPTRVPSGLPTVRPLPNQSPEMEAFKAESEPLRRAVVPRIGKRLLVKDGMRIQDAVDQAQAGDTVLVMPGTYHETLTLDLSNLTLLGVEEGGKRPVLDGRRALSDGVVGSGSNLEIRNFKIRDYSANGVMIDLATNVTFRDLYLENTGLYGVYPVEVVGVLVERCTVTGVRDAGIYVGQSKDIVVRDSEVYGNVTGIEIENSLNAVVENNEVYNNTAGVLVFGLPNNPSKISKNCKVVNNRIYDNNLDNFGDPTAIVSRTPSGSGVIIMAGDDVEVAGNEIRGNNSFGIGVSGLDQFFEPGMSYDIDPTSDNCWIHDNTLIDNGGDPHQSILDAGFEGADLLWDVTGKGNRWDQPGASRLPYILPGPNWSELRHRANERLWRLAMQVL